MGRCSLCKSYYLVPKPPFPFLRPRRLPLCHLRALHDALDPGTFRKAANIITEMGHS